MFVDDEAGLKRCRKVLVWVSSYLAPVSRTEYLLDVLIVYMVH